MMASFPEVRIGDPVRYEGLAVFPLFGAPPPVVEYDLAPRAIGKGVVGVQEISEAGSVPDLLVENRGEVRVLFLEGEELVGAKQNRILNTSVLVPARTKCRIPVSCVEAGRWGYRTRHFSSGGTHAPYGLKGMVKGSVHRSLQAGRGHRSDQGRVWDEVEHYMKATGSVSPTGAMHDAYASHGARVEEFTGKLGYVEGAIGLAVAVAGRVAAVDLFDKPATCVEVWSRLLTGAALEALAAGVGGRPAEAVDVERLLAGLSGVAWEPVQSVGEGQEYRVCSASGDHASALVFESTVVHASVIHSRN